MKIYLGLSSPSSKFAPFAELIKWVLKREYDHCYVRFQEPNGEWMIFQASGLAVNVCNTQIWLKKNYSVKEYEVEITKEQNDFFWQFVKDTVGTPYSLKEDFGILLMKVFHLDENPYDAGMSAQICSQLMAEVCKRIGIRIDQNTSTIDPSAMDKILEARGFPCVLKADLSAY